MKKTETFNTKIPLKRFLVNVTKLNIFLPTDRKSYHNYKLQNSITFEWNKILKLCKRLSFQKILAFIEDQHEFLNPYHPIAFKYYVRVPFYSILQILVQTKFTAAPWACLFMIFYRHYSRYWALWGRDKSCFMFRLDNLYYNFILTD